MYQYRGPRAIGALSLVLLLLTGCKEGADATGSSPTVLTVLMADDWAATEPVTDVVRRFERDHPGVQVRIQGLPFPQIPEAVRATLASGGTVDVAQWHAFAAAAQGLAEPLGDLWKAHMDPADLLPGAVEDVEWAGELYGVPLDTNALVLMVNRDELRAAGLEPSDLSSLDGFVAAVRQVATERRFGIALSNSSWVTYGLIRAHGGELVEVADDGSVRFLLDSAEVVETLSLLERFVGDGTASGAPSQNVSTNSYAMFQSGTSVMHLSGTWDVAALLQSDVPWELDVLPLPKGAPDAGTVMGGSSLFVPIGSPHRELAFEFMRQLTDPDVGLDLARQEGRIPATLAALEDPLFDSEVYRTVVEALPSASAMKLIAFPEAAQAFSNAVQDVLSGSATAADALRDAQRAAELSQK